MAPRAFLYDYTAVVRLVYPRRGYDTHDDGLDGCSYNGCPLDGCPLDGCSLDGCPLDGCSLDGCSLDGCPLDGCPLVVDDWNLSLGSHSYRKANSAYIPGIPDYEPLPEET
jgi:hypothetical protein